MSQQGMHARRPTTWRRAGRGANDGILAHLSRAIVVGPMARLELTAPAESRGSGDNPGSIIEAQIPAQQFRELGLREGETLVVKPRRARVFVEDAAWGVRLGGMQVDPELV